MKYVGILEQQSRNNFRSILLLLCFPTIILLLVWSVIALTSWVVNADEASYFDWDGMNAVFLETLPWVLGIVGIWFVVAYFINTWVINRATGAKPLTRRENSRVYNILENLCISRGMRMPKLYMVQDGELNAYASGINENTYAVTVTSGLLQTLDDRELEGVIAHELTHIRNRDTRLLIISIVFVGIISTVLNIAVRSLTNSVFHSGRSNRNGKNNQGGAIILLLISVVCTAIAYLFVQMTRFAISRKREYMADAGAAELTHNPLALASALRKIADHTGLASCARDDVAQLFIALPANGKKGPGFLKRIFSTHPDIHERIALLEQF